MIGERIRFFRKNIHWKQADFAKILGISQTHVSKIENGADMPSPQLVERICATFGINKTWLEKGEGEILASEDIRNNIDNQQQTLILQILKQLDSENKSSDDVVKLLCEVMNFCNMANFFEDRRIITCREILSPVIQDMYKLIEYVKTQYPRIDSKEEIRDYFEYMALEKEINEIKELYIQGIERAIDTILIRIMASGSAIDVWVDHIEEFGFDDNK